MAIINVRASTHRCPVSFRPSTNSATGSLGRADFRTIVDSPSVDPLISVRHSVCHWYTGQWTAKPEPIFSRPAIRRIFYRRYQRCIIFVGCAHRQQRWAQPIAINARINKTWTVLGGFYLTRWRGTRAGFASERQTRRTYLSPSPIRWRWVLLDCRVDECIHAKFSENGRAEHTERSE